MLPIKNKAHCAEHSRRWGGACFTTYPLTGNH
nr:MAG TPA: hypothetical protein [Caudoviricetes sp.]